MVVGVLHSTESQARSQCCNATLAKLAMAHVHHPLALMHQAHGPCANQNPVTAGPSGQCLTPENPQAMAASRQPAEQVLNTAAAAADNAVSA